MTHPPLGGAHPLTEKVKKKNQATNRPDTRNTRTDPFRAGNHPGERRRTMRYEYVLPRPASFGTHSTGHLTGIRQGADGHDIAVYDRPLDRDTVRDHELTEQPLFAWRLAVGTHPEQVTPATIATHANAAKHLILCVAPYHWREPGPTIAVAMAMHSVTPSSRRRTHRS